MGKRSTFERKARDFYPTPYEAVLPLLPHLPDGVVFDEPCAGDRDLVAHLTTHGHDCARASDVSDRYPVDAFDLKRTGAQMFITNPPWPLPGKNGDPTISMAIHLSDMLPTWFLLNADVAHNKYFRRVEHRCRKIVSVGRVSWAGNGVKGKENCAWMLFDKPAALPTEFYGQAA